jgi:hypothetical protein
VEKSGKKVENNFWPEWNFFLKKIKKWKSGKVETQVESGSGWNFQLLPQNIPFKSLILDKKKMEQP